MIFRKVKTANWMNFPNAEFELTDRVFVVGPNASGKSNLLDLFRFLRDIASPGGGLQGAVRERGGLSKIRCLAARKFPNVEITVDLAESPEKASKWRYALSIEQETRGHRNPILVYEKVWKEEKLILDRPDPLDKKDPARLTQTHLEQINANVDFREIGEIFSEIQYLHLVPQLLRYPWMFSPSGSQRNGARSDPFGLNFLERVARTPERTRTIRLRRIEKALKYAVPYFKELGESTDESGRPHLEVRYKHWRLRGAKQREDQFSDGTLRLIGLLWSLLEGDSLLLLEEPELSLNHAIVRQIPRMINTANKDRKRRRQIIISTHSESLLSSQEIGLEEILLLTPAKEGTEVVLASSKNEIVKLLEGGMSPGEAVMPYTEPRDISQLSLLEK
jgi:predicted ATPase